MPRRYVAYSCLAAWKRLGRCVPRIYVYWEGLAMRLLAGCLKIAAHSGIQVLRVESPIAAEARIGSEGSEEVPLVILRHYELIAINKESQ